MLAPQGWRPHLGEILDSPLVTSEVICSGSPYYSGRHNNDVSQLFSPLICSPHKVINDPSLNETQDATIEE